MRSLGKKHSTRLKVEQRVFKQRVGGIGNRTLVNEDSTGSSPVLSTNKIIKLNIMKRIIDDWFSENWKLFCKDIDEYHIDNAKYDLIEKLKGTIKKNQQ